MALETPGWVISAAEHSAALFRQTVQSLMGGTGVVNAGDLAVTQNGTPNLSVNVAAGFIWIPGTQGSSTGFGANAGSQSGYTGLSATASFNSQGPYGAYQDATVNLPIATPNASHARIDCVVASAQDSYYSGSYNQVILQVVEGTASASPAVPTIPAASVVLAQIAVGAGVSSITTSNITDERPFLSLLLAPRAPVMVSRSLNMTYTPNASQATMVYATFTLSMLGSSASGVSCLVNGTVISEAVLVAGSATMYLPVTVLVPPGGTYSFALNTGTASLASCFEQTL